MHKHIHNTALLFSPFFLKRKTRQLGMSEVCAFLGPLRSGDEAGVERLVAAGVPVGTRDRYGLTALHYAALYGRAGALTALLRGPGAAVDARSASGTTPLHHAARAGHDACVRALLAAGADARARDAAGWTPLAFAAHGARAGAVALLLAHAGDGARALADTPTAAGDTPLRLAAMFGHTDCVRALLRAGASTRVPAPPGSGAPEGCALAALPLAAPPAVTLSADVRPDPSRAAAQFAALLTPEMQAVVPPDVRLVPGGSAGDDDMDTGALPGAHRAVLVARCPFFREYFVQQHQKEKEQNKEHESGASAGATTIVVPHATKKDLELVLEWVYTGTIAALFSGDKNKSEEKDGKQEEMKETTATTTNEGSTTDGAGEATTEEKKKEEETLPLIPKGREEEFARLLRVALGLFPDEKGREGASLVALLATAFAAHLDAASAGALWAVAADAALATDATAQRLLAQALAWTLAQPPAVAAPLYARVDALPRAQLCALLDTLRVAAAPTSPEAFLSESTDAPALMPADLAPNGPEAVRTEIAETNALLGRAVLAQELTPAHTAILQRLVRALYNNQLALWFRAPVDEERDGAIGYRAIIKHPMDLGTLSKRYCAKTLPAPPPRLIDAVNAGRTIWQNAFTYNKPDSGVFAAAHKLAHLWESSVRSAAWPGRPAPPAPGPADGTAASSAEAQPMTQRELDGLARALEALPPTDVPAVLGIAGVVPTGDTAELDLSRLPPRVLREIETYARLHAPAAKKSRTADVKSESAEQSAP